MVHHQALTILLSKQKNRPNFVFTCFHNNVLDCQMPEVIKRAVCKQNVHFLHNRIQYSVEFFQFMRKLVAANASLENTVCKP